MKVLPQRSASPRFIRSAVLAEAVAFAGHRITNAHNWRGSGGFFDVASHINNAWGTAGAVALVAAMAINKNALYSVPVKKALCIGGLALTIGLGINAATETPGTSVKIIEHITHRPESPDWRDEVYGDVTGIITAGALTWAMTVRKTDIPQPVSGDLPHRN